MFNVCSSNKNCSYARRSSADNFVFKDVDAFFCNQNCFPESFLLFVLLFVLLIIKILIYSVLIYACTRIYISSQSIKFGMSARIEWLLSKRNTFPCFVFVLVCVFFRLYARAYFIYVIGLWALE
jgi:hypothetical protein